MIKAKWKKLVLANYVVDESVLLPYLPFATEPEYWDKQCFISLVGFMFLDTKVMGLKFPGHVNFEEVNLRFYVRHADSKFKKRGVVFIKEIVSLHGITFVANTVYKEHYETHQMNHVWSETDDMVNVQYDWKLNKWQSLKISSHPTPLEMLKGSQELFFTDQHWGYTSVHPQLTLEYEVAHPDWKYYTTKNFNIDVDFGQVYGEPFSFLSAQKPYSVFLAEGSEISLRKTGKFHP